MFVRPNVIVGATRSSRTCLQTTNLVAALSSTTNKILIIHRDLKLFVPSYNELLWRFYEENYVWILRSRYLSTIPASLLCCNEFWGMGGTGILFQLALTVTVLENRLLFTIHVAHVAIPSKLTF